MLVCGNEFCIPIPSHSHVPIPIPISVPELHRVYPIPAGFPQEKWEFRTPVPDATSYSVGDRYITTFCIKS